MRKTNKSRNIHGGSSQRTVPVQAQEFFEYMMDVHGARMAGHKYGQSSSVDKGSAGGFWIAIVFG